MVVRFCMSVPDIPGSVLFDSRLIFRISDFSFVLFGGYDDNVRRRSLMSVGP